MADSKDSKALPQKGEKAPTAASDTQLARAVSLTMDGHQIRRSGLSLVIFEIPDDMPVEMCATLSTSLHTLCASRNFIEASEFCMFAFFTKTDHDLYNFIFPPPVTPSCPRSASHQKLIDSQMDVHHAMFSLLQGAAGNVNRVLVLTLGIPKIGLFSIGSITTTKQKTPKAITDLRQFIKIK